LIRAIEALEDWKLGRRTIVGQAFFVLHEMLDEESVCLVQAQEAHAETRRRGGDTYIHTYYSPARLDLSRCSFKNKKKLNQRTQADPSPGGEEQTLVGKVHQ